MAYRVGTQERKIMNTPTKITVSRIAMIAVMLIVLFFFGIFQNQLPVVELDLGGPKISVVYLVCTVVFIIAAFTDWLDGYLARKNNQVTDLGKFLDPIADKLLIDGMMIFILIPQAYAPSHNIHMGDTTRTILAFCVIAMIARDLIVDALRLIAVTKNQVIAANIFGKMKTVMQMIAIPLMLLNGFPFSYFDANWIGPLHIKNIFFYLATIMSVVSGIIYVVQNFKVLKSNK